jgi:hypothetical protein
VSLILNRRESATVLAALRLLAGDGVRIPNYPRVLVAGLSDEIDAEYDLRFDADGQYVRELIDRIDEMSLRGVKLCIRCTEKHSGQWRGKPGKARSARSAIGMLSGILCCRRLRLWRGGRAAVSAKADEWRLEEVIVRNESWRIVESIENIAEDYNIPLIVMRWMLICHRRGGQHCV